MRDKIEISTQLLRADVAEMSLWWGNAESRKSGCWNPYWKRFQKCGAGQQSICGIGNIDSYYQNCKAGGSGWGGFWSLCGDVVRRMSAASGN